jgi:uncharacterized protein
MDEIKKISLAKLNYLAGEKKFNIIFLEKDYYLTVLLYFLRDIKGLHFKGGTALNKIFLEHQRLSEDLDFTSTKPINEIKEEVVKAIKEHPDFFYKVGFEKQTPSYSRIKAYYESEQPDSFVLIDINTKASVLLKPEDNKIPHFYDEIPEFVITTLNKNELVAEKIRTMFQRKKARDYYDAYFIITKKFIIDKNLLKRKLKEAGKEYKPEIIFKNANKIYSFWDSEISSLTNKPIDYHTAIKTIATQFEYKKTKKKIKTKV